MKRSRLRRKTPLRSGGIEKMGGKHPSNARAKGIPKRNNKRWKRLYSKNFGDHADHIRKLPCDTCGKPGPSDPSHALSRGAGGDRRELFPQCRPCHQAYERNETLTLDEARARAAHYWAMSPFNDESEDA